MPEFSCDSPVCNGYLEAHTRDELMRQVEQHFQDVHQVSPTQTILGYLASTVRDEAGSSAR